MYVCWQTSHLIAQIILFLSFAARKAELGISSFGVSVTTMEEVFMKVGEGTEETLETRWVGMGCGYGVWVWGVGVGCGCGYG